MTTNLKFSNLEIMPRSGERRAIEYFISGYNAVRNSPIEHYKADEMQDVPDAICFCSDGHTIALEHTSVFPPKGTEARRHKSSYNDLSPLSRVLARKLNNDYRVSGVDEVWLLVHIRKTLPKDLVLEALRDIQIPVRYNRIFLHWPVPLGGRVVNMGLLEIPSREFWFPKPPLT